jgi:carbamate kinase
VKKKAVIAFGGNVLLPHTQKGLQKEQEKNAELAAKDMVNIIEKGYELLIVHGNGPQVGNILIQMEKASNKIPPFTIDVCDAMTEGSMGYMIEKALLNELRKHSIDKDVATIITQVIVDKDDSAFHSPTKPIGPFYNELRAGELKKDKKWIMVEDAGRGWRRVVPSPRPIDIVPKIAIRRLIDTGTIVIVAGGGGVPVIINQDGLIEGVEAVIDKDFASSLIAQEIEADLFIILTGVDRVAINFGKPNQKEIKKMSVNEAEKYLKEGQFPAGSMGPKIRAAIEFIKNGGKEVLITTPGKIRGAFAKRTGTIIYKEG